MINAKRMQHTDEIIAANKKGIAIRAFIILVAICLLVLIFSQSIPEIGINDNTYGNSQQIGEQRLNAKRQLADLSKSAAQDNVYVRIGGKPIGISVNAGGLIVLGLSEVDTESGAVSPALDAGIKTGDVLYSVNGEQVTSIFRLKMISDEFNGNEMELAVLRDGNLFTVRLVPAIDRATGQKKLGLMLKEDVGGVGTLTFVTQDGRFGALGHFITDGESGLDYELTYGNIYRTEIDGVIKGESGKAGGLIADVNRLSSPVGIIARNTDIGLFGEYTADYDAELYRIATKGEAKPGAAKVYTTVDGSEPKFYDIDIVKVISQSEPAEKGMVIAVRDKELLEKTGGIVQGMSGSPIIQNGILVGAVTHVFIQDPTRGYAVHSRFMYDYAVNSAAAYREAA